MTSHRGLKNTKGIMAERRAARDFRNAIRASRTDAEQIVVLDQRLGSGVGAKRERKRLLTPKIVEEVKLSRTQQRRAKRKGVKLENQQ